MATVTARVATLEEAPPPSADISRTRTDLGYEPTVTFEDGLEKTLKWHAR